MQNVLFYLLMIATASGVLLRSFLFVPYPIAFLGLLVAGSLFLLCWRSGVVRPQSDTISVATRQVVLIAAVILAALIVGTIRFSTAEDSLLATKVLPTGTALTVTGTIIREPEAREQSTLLTLLSSSTRILITVDRHSPVHYGDHVTVSGKVKVPDSFVTDTGRTFDYPGYLAARGIVYTMAYPHIEVVAPVSLFNPLGYLYKLKAYVLHRLSLVLPEPQMGLGAGLLLGVQSALGTQLEADFRTVGIVHIVVLSGYNIMLVATFFMIVLGWFLLWRARLIGAALMVVAFALLVGYVPSVLRATVMALIVLGTKFIARPYVVLRALLLAAVVMILINPYLLRYDVGFQLSFLATLGLIVLSPLCERFLTRVPSAYGVREILVATISTQIMVAPILLYAMGNWSLVAIPVNLIVLPMVAVAMTTTFATALVALISTAVAYIPGILAYASLSYIILIATWVAQLPLASVNIPPFSPWLIPVMYLGISIWWYLAVYRPTKESLVVASLIVDGGLLIDGEVWTVTDEEETPATTPKVLHTKDAAATGVAAASSSSTPIFFR